MIDRIAVHKWCRIDHLNRWGMVAGARRVFKKKMHKLSRSASARIARDGLLEMGRSREDIDLDMARYDRILIREWHKIMDRRDNSLVMIEHELFDLQCI